MARHHRIVETLTALTREGLIDGWVKDTDPKNPSKIHWVVQLDKYNTRRWETIQVEAFLDGVTLTSG